jgi:hypothetical protein
MHVAKDELIRMVERRGSYRALVGGNMRERNHMVKQGVDRTIILKCIFRKCDGL